MAVTSVWAIKGRVDKVINYARNPEKTQDRARLSELHEIKGVIDYAADELKTKTRAYVSCLNLQSEETAAMEFMETKRLFAKEGGRACYHGYQSFRADEVDAAAAHEIGVKLAKELWGDRFQVLIATHCNTGHYHNHFVINSVSDTDGKKFCNSPADYRRMREVSDRLCREAHISVVENRQGRSESYGEWLAEKNGKPTVRGTIRADLDRAILASVTEHGFIRVMGEMGYEIQTRTQTGAPLKYPKLKPPGAKGFFRFHSLGKGYGLDSIKRRIQENVRKREPFPEADKLKKQPYRFCREKTKKATGLFALYLHYCYELRLIARHTAPVKKVPLFLREELIRLDKYISQANFLGKTGISTAGELAEYKTEAAKQAAELTGRRKKLRGRLRQAVGSGDEGGAAEIKAQIRNVSAELKRHRKEIALCDGIAERSEQVLRSLRELERQKENDGKEETADELSIRRSGGAGREDDAERR